MPYEMTGEVFSHTFSFVLQRSGELRFFCCRKAILVRIMTLRKDFRTHEYEFEKLWINRTL
jgi:hypothetical protein